MKKRAFAGTRFARVLRLFAAVSVLALAAFGFLAAGDAGTSIARAVASFQLIPALDRAAGFVVAVIASGAGFAGASACVAALALVAVSAIFGRWYCAALCPLGTLQDSAALIGRKRRRFRAPRTPLRVVILIAFACASVAGTAALASWIEPWSILGRFFSNGAQPLVRVATRADIPGVTPVAVILSAVVMFGLLDASALHPRWFCGRLCPAGTILGALNAIAPFRLRLDEAACVSCGRCASVCRASCVDPKGKKIDDSRCVYCLACADACPTRAIRYGLSGKGARLASADASATTTDASTLTRAQFLSSLGGGAAALALAALPGRAYAERSLSRAVGRDVLKPVVPPGARSAGRFLDRCTACGLCVSRCPSKVLQPSLGQLGLGGMFAPRLDFSISYCQFDCVACLESCPSGALEKMTLERKRLVKIGDASFIRAKCVVITNGTKCGACAEHCPTGAVRMVVGETRLPEPVFTSAICIGCGACHHACPVRPDRAISVSGLETHGVAETPSASLFDAPASPADAPSASAGAAGSAGSAGSPALPGSDAFPF